MKYDINMKARLTFVAFLLIVIIAGAIWHVFSENHYATYQVYTEDSVSGLIADAPIEFHGVDVGKVKSIKLVNPHLVRILLSIDKTAPITSASATEDGEDSGLTSSTTASRKVDPRTPWPSAPHRGWSRPLNRYCRKPGVRNRTRP